MGDEHLDTIPATESNEFIKTSVENLISIPSESKGIPDHRCDVPSHDNSLPLDVSKDQFEDFSESNDEFSSTDDDSFSYDKIDYVEASPPDSKLVKSEVMEIVISEVGGIEALNDNPIPFYDPIISGTPPNLTPSGESDFFLEVLFNAEYESDSSDDQSCSDEDVLEKIVSKPLSEEVIIPIKPLRTHDSSLPVSSKIDSLLDEFAGELTLLKSIPPGIDETDYNFEEDIRLIEKLLYNNSSPRPPKEFVSVNSEAKTESFSPSPILVKDSDSLMEEIDLFCTPDYPMPPGIVDEDYDSERDILILKDLPSNNTLSFAEKESFHFDIPLFSRPSANPPDGNSYVYDPNPNSFDCPPDSYHPPHPTYETYSYDSYGNNSQFGYDCQPQFPHNYESEPGYNENYNSYPYDSSSFPQQYPCCTRCGGPHETCQCDQLIFDEPYFSRHSSTSSRIEYLRDGGSKAAVFR
nr:hypothetical protein [Tanacetum cinerariifolium]